MSGPATTPAERAATGRRIRLVKFVTAFSSGGTERQFVNLAVGLDRERFDVRFGCLRRSGQLMDELDARQIGVDEYPIRSFYRPSAWAAQCRLARDLRASQVDIVHAYNFYGNVFAVPAARLAGVPVVVASIRDMGVYLDATQRRVQRWACRLADRVLVNAEAIKRWLVQDGYDGDRIDVIPNGIDLRRFNEPSPDTSTRRSLGLADDAPMVLLVSRLVPRKGIEHFLEAAARVAARVPGARFVIVGEPAEPAGDASPDYLAGLERHAERVGVRGKVVFTGLRRDVASLMAEATVSVLPSLSEGLSNVLLESMATGAPVVATRVGGAPDVVQDGTTGLLVPPGSPAELARAILTMIEQPRLAARLGAAGRQVVAERFSIDRMVEATEREYLSLLARSPRRRAVAC